jgi:hypothetical protein
MLTPCVEALRGSGGSVLLVGLLVTQVFNFTDSQFRAVAELPFDLLVLALVYRLRSGGVTGARPRVVSFLVGRYFTEC